MKNTEDFLREICPNHTDSSKWNKSELLTILDKHQALQLQQGGVMCSDIVSDAELDKAFENTQYGKRNKRDIILENLKKIAQSCGYTSIEIMKYLGLIEERNNSYGLSDKGLKYLLLHND